MMRTKQPKSKGTELTVLKQEGKESDVYVRCTRSLRLNMRAIVHRGNEVGSCYFKSNVPAPSSSTK